MEWSRNLVALEYVVKVKILENYGCDWNVQLPYNMMFTYPHDSTLESAFLLLYGHDVRTYLNDPYSCSVELGYQVDNSDYKSEMVANLSDT